MLQAHTEPKSPIRDILIGGKLLLMPWTHLNGVMYKLQLLLLKCTKHLEMHLVERERERESNGIAIYFDYITRAYKAKQPMTPIVCTVRWSDCTIGRDFSLISRRKFQHKHLQLDAMKQGYGANCHPLFRLSKHRRTERRISDKAIDESRIESLWASIILPLHKLRMSTSSVVVVYVMKD